MWTLIGTFNYILYTNDLDFLKSNWDRYTKGVEYILGKLTNSGMMSVTGKRDWARWYQGGVNSEANMLLFHTLNTAARLAMWKGDEKSALVERYTNHAQTLRESIINRLYDKEAKVYKDSIDRANLHPQDANAMAILFDVATPMQKYDISSSLTKNWRLYGPESPELPGNVSPFISSLELQAHFSIASTTRALDLLKRTWGWYLLHPNGTQSTMIEGFRADGWFGYRNERGYANDSSYISHSHGWSTGPTSALTNYVAGLDILERAGSRWKFAPQFGGLDFAEAGFMTKRGLFRSRWILNKVLGGGYNVTLEAPNSTVGEIHLPSLRGTSMLVAINNVTRDFQEDGMGVHFELPGGSYNITVRSVDMLMSPLRGSSSGGSTWWP
jgi:hypothetical protein